MTIYYARLSKAELGAPKTNGAFTYGKTQALWLAGSLVRNPLELCCGSGPFLT